MDLFSIFTLSLGLSFDTFAVSISCGLKEKKIQFMGATRIALYFAYFQALMLLLGWILGISIKQYISPIDHWLAFLLLSVIGLNMIIDSFKEEKKTELNITNLKVIVAMSLATTIDAFAVGVTYAFLNVNLPWVLVIIGITTYIMAMLGMLFGKKICHTSGNKIEILGGAILIFIGLKILLEHLLH